jgi:pimeloyl-ACP methyl ester carboxylesterase
MTNAMIQEQIQVAPDLPLTLKTVGSGRPVLVLHGGHGPGNSAPYVENFAGTSQVLLPTHPGFDGTPRPDWFNGVDDIANTYLNLLEDRDLNDVLVVATSFGGWIAAEMATRDRGHRIGRLVLIGSNGPEVPGHEMVVRDSAVEGVVPMELVYIYAGGKEMRDPKLLRRLGRVQIPTLVIWGEHDWVLPPAYGQAVADAFANGRFQVIPGAEHIPAHEAPEATFAAINAFVAEE